MAWLSGDVFLEMCVTSLSATEEAHWRANEGDVIPMMLIQNSKTHPGIRYEAHESDQGSRSTSWSLIPLAANGKLNFDN